MSKKKAFYLFLSSAFVVAFILAILIMVFGVSLNSRASLAEKGAFQKKDEVKIKPLVTGMSTSSGTYLDVGDDPDRIEVVEVKQITTEGYYSLGDLFGKHAWSPDGRYFFATKARRTTTIIFNENGQKLREGSYDFKDWSPDSKKIICEDMLLVDIETGQQRKVTEEIGYDQAFLPSGDKIIFHSKDGLSVVDINTGKIEVLLNAPGENFSDVWYVSEDKVFYLRNKKGFDSYLYRYNSITKNQNRIFPYETPLAQYLLTPNRDIRIYAGNDPKGGDRIIIDQEGKVLTKIIYDIGGDWEAHFRDFSPNGRLILCLEDEMGDQEWPIKGDLYIYSFDGMKKKKITSTENIIEEQAKWSPKGNKIIFSDYDNGYVFLITITIK
jgi:Tol biopolymer transport system component